MGSLPQQANPKPVKKQKVRPSLEPGVEGPAAEDGNSKFARALSSVDWHTREKGLQALIRFLAIREDLSDGDLLRLWKGLFYCFWHSDKVPVQASDVPHIAPPTPPTPVSAASDALQLRRDCRRTWQTDWPPLWASSSRR